MSSPRHSSILLSLTSGPAVYFIDEVDYHLDCELGQWGVFYSNQYTSTFLNFSCATRCWKFSKADFIPSRSTEWPLHGVSICSGQTTTSTDEDIHVRMMLDYSGEVVRTHTLPSTHPLISADFMSGWKPKIYSQPARLQLWEVTHYRTSNSWYFLIWQSYYARWS